MDSKSQKNQSGFRTSEAEARREFLKNIGKVTATAPAVALLLAASAKSASAQSPYQVGDGDAGDADSTCLPVCEGGSSI